MHGIINIKYIQTSMAPAGFEPAVPASERPQTHALDPAATGVGKYKRNQFHDFPMKSIVRRLLWPRGLFAGVSSRFVVQRAFVLRRQSEDEAKIEALVSSESSEYARRHIPEDYLQVCCVAGCT